MTGLSSGAGLTVSTGLSTSNSLAYGVEKKFSFSHFDFVYDADAIQIFESFTTPPSTARKIVINDLVVALKAGGIWPLLDTFWILAAADSQASTINWKTPGFYTITNTSGGTAPTFTADRGWAGNATTQFLDTNFTPTYTGLNYTINSAEFGAWVRTDVQQAGPVIGGATGVRALIIPRTTGNLAQFRANDTTTSSTAATVTVGTGLFSGVRLNSANKQIFRNATQIGTDFAVAATATPNAGSNWYICAANGSTFSSRQISGAYIGGLLTNTQRTALYNAMSTYMTAVGA